MLRNYSVMLTALILLVTTFTSALATEEKLVVEYRVKRFSPGYYSNTTAQFNVMNLTDLYAVCANPRLAISFSAQAPDNKRAEGLSATDLVFIMPEENLYVTFFEQVIHARSSSLTYDAMDLQVVCLEQGGVRRELSQRYHAQFSMERAGFEWSEWQRLGLQQ